MDKELIVVKGKVIEQERGYSPDSGKDIGYETGAKMVKRHFDENPNEVVAHFFGKNRIEQILAQPGCIGIRTLYGVNDLGVKALIIVGVNDAGKNILQINAPSQLGRSTTKGIVMGGVKSCPPYCPDSDSSSNSNWW